MVVITAVCAVFAIGYLSLKSQLEPIADPWFSIMKILIIVEMPILVALMVAVHAWTPENSNGFIDVDGAPGCVFVRSEVTSLPRGGSGRLGPAALGNTLG